MKVVATRNFQFDGREVKQGDALDLPSAEARLMMARGRAREEHVIEQAAADEVKPSRRRGKRVYGTRDMVAGETPQSPTPESAPPETPPAPADEQEIKGGE